MKKTKKILALILVMGIVCLSFSGCNKKEDSLVKDITGIAPETAVLKINGQDISAEMYYYWLSIVCEDISTYFSDGIAWDEILYDDVTVNEYVKESILGTLSQYQVVSELSAEYPDLLTAEEKQKHLDEVIAYNVEMFGSEKEFEKSLAESGVSKETILYLYETQNLYSVMQDKFYEDGGPFAATDADLTTYLSEQYGAENGVYSAKHILVSTRDENNVDLPDDQKAAKKALAEDLLAQLRSSDDPTALFDSLRAEYSEDPGQPEEGYTFREGDMVDEFYRGTAALQDGEISDLIPSDFGYHIILRLPSVIPTLDEAREEYPSFHFNKLFSDRVASVKIEFTDLSLMEPSEYYPKYLAS